MKKLIIKNKLSNPERTYEFHLNFMHGDGDDYSKDIIHVSQDNPMVQEFANFLASLKNEESPHKVHGEFFAKLQENNKELKKELREIYIDYPYDNTSDDTYPASFNGLDIFYYDEIGNKFVVKLED